MVSAVVAVIAVMVVSVMIGLDWGPLCFLKAGHLLNFQVHVGVVLVATHKIGASSVFQRVFPE